MRRNLHLNSLANVEVLPVGLGTEEGTAFLAAHNDPSRAATSPQGEEEVKIVPLDSVVSSRRITFIKIDVEGFELPVLRGASATIERDRPTILFEKRSEARDFLTTRGYRFEQLSETNILATNG